MVRKAPFPDNFDQRGKRFYGAGSGIYDVTALDRSSSRWVAAEPFVVIRTMHADVDMHIYTRTSYGVTEGGRRDEV